MERVLITGSTGLIGKALSTLLKEEGYHVCTLVRNKSRANGSSRFYWDYKNYILDEGALDGVHYIIHLAGATVSKRWTSNYKKEIYESRIHSANFLFEHVRREQTPLKKFISASGTGFYGDNTTLFLKETAPPGNDFLANVCKDWEHAANQFNTLGIPVCIFRTGVVMTPTGGFIPTVSRIIKTGFGSHLGSGKQVLSWISLHDICRAYLFALQNKSLEGVFNASTSNPMTAAQIDDVIARHYHTKIRLPNVPASVLKLFLGEMSSIILTSCHADNGKLKESGFTFLDEELEKVIDQN